MSFAIFNIAWVALYLIAGFQLLLRPEQVLQQFGMSLLPERIYLLIIMGMALVSMALFLHLNRDTAPGQRGQKNMLLMNCIYNLINMPILSMAVLSGFINFYGWIAVILHALLAVSFGYFAFKAETQAMA